MMRMIFSVTLIFVASLNCAEETTRNWYDFDGCCEDDSENDPLTALYLISMPGDWIGDGKTMAYIDGKDGKFEVNGSDKWVGITFRNSTDQWSISFAPSANEYLSPGIYKNAHRFSEDGSPAFQIYGHGHCCNTSDAEFEILEIQCDDNNKIESFAANFVQKCERNGPPLFGTVRYNSRIPIEERFSHVFYPGLALFFGVFIPELQHPIGTAFLYTSDYCIKRLPYGGEGIEIKIKGLEDTEWTLDFAAPLNEEFTVGSYLGACRYPFHSPYDPGIEIITPEGAFIQPIGEFEVIDLVKGSDGIIESLALNFKACTKYGQRIVGCVRLNSNVPEKKLNLPNER